MRITISPHLSGLVVALAFATTLSMAGMVSASADVSPVATDQPTTTSGSDSSAPTDSPQPEPTPTPPKPTYTSITARKQLNYYTTMGGNATYKIYKTGGYNTSASNKIAVSTSRQFVGKSLHITQSERTGGITWLKFTYNHKFSGWVNQHATVSTTYKLWVPLIAQRPQLPTGCEITATAMMLQFAGAKVTKLSLTREMPRSSDPNKGFVGSPYSKSGWYIYPKAVLPIVKRHLGSAQNLTGARLSTIKKYVRHDHPVVVYVAGVDGFSNHALTVTGYSKTRIYYNDPWTNKRASMSNSVMTKHRKADANRAFSY
ncbi:C39 family peptidase [Secundilactobacillus kimchicus]|uniref:C39 family peptidase n=1 Tax=Secundilactobacillus kimchicus TaxID=528209 RepID=UPI0006D14D6A|nr:C39 family peptidase [Secundilactobacillus kimchicus]